RGARRAPRSSSPGTPRRRPTRSRPGRPTSSWWTPPSGRPGGGPTRWPGRPATGTRARTRSGSRSARRSRTPGCTAGRRWSCGAGPGPTASSSPSPTRARGPPTPWSAWPPSPRTPATAVGCGSSSSSAPTSPSCAPRGPSPSACGSPAPADRPGGGRRPSARQDVLVGVRPQRALPVLEQRERPVLADPTARVLVPAVHVGGAPGHELVGPVDLLVEPVVHLPADVDGPLPPAEGHLEEAHDVPHPALGEVDDAAVDDDVGVRAVEAEQVGEAGHGDAEVGAGLALPVLVQVDAVPPGHLHRGEELRGGEAGPVDDHVDVVGRAVDGDDAARGDLPDAGGDQAHVVPLQRARPHAVVA